MSLNTKDGREITSGRKTGVQLGVIEGVVIKDKEQKALMADRIQTTEIAVEKLHDSHDKKGWDKLNHTMMNSAKEIDFGQQRAKLGLTSQEL